MNKYLWILCLICAASFSVADAIGQELQLSFNHLTKQDGLSEAYNAFIYKDSRGFVWISSSDGLNRFDGLNVKVYKPRSGDAHSLLGNNISSSFFEDSASNLWFTTYNAIHRYNREKDHFDRFRLQDEKGQEILEDYYAFHLDPDGYLWVRTGPASSGTLHWFQINPTSKNPHRDSLLGPLNGQRITVIPNSSGEKQVVSTYIPRQYGFEVSTYGPTITKEVFRRPKTEKWVSDFQSRAVYPEADTLVWVIMNGELLAFNPVNQTMKAYRNFEENTVSRLSSISPLGKDLLAIGSLRQGIWIFHKKQRQFTQLISPNPNNPLSLPFTSVNDLYLDDHQNLWVSNWRYGIAYANLAKHKFPILLEGASVSAIYETPNKEIWAGTTKGIFVYDKEGNQIHHLPSWEARNGQKSSRIIEFIFTDQQDQVWGISGPALLMWDQSRGLFVQKERFDFSPYDVIKLTEGQILLASGSGLFTLRRQDDSYKLASLRSLTEQYPGFYTKIFEDQKGRLFLSENRNRLLVLEKQGEEYQILLDKQDVGDIKAFYENPITHHIWMAGSQGLYLFANDTVRIENTVPNETYVQIIGHEDHLWLSGKSGLIQFSPENKTYRNFLPSDGLLTTTANLNAIYQGNNGDIWLGSSRGINLIPADTIPSVSFPPDVQLTKLLINDQEVDDSLYIGERSVLELPYAQNTLSFEFSALEYSDAPRNQFQYRLIGYDEDWIAIVAGDKGFVRYPNLPPQDYTLEIKAANSDGLWSNHPQQLSITIRPPFWQTWWFRGLALLAIAAIVWGLYRTQLNRQLAQAEANRLRELDDFKNRLYTNITHEFRTPLTVILGMANVFKDNHNPVYLQAVQLIRNNGQKLLRLINQILDLAKLESGHLKLDLVQRDIIPHLFYLAESFQHYAESQGIRLLVESEVSEVVMDFDENKLQDIIANLLSNAIKFTPKEGIISVHINQITKDEDSQLFVTVKDSGVGISEEHLPHIFERFYQIDNSISLRGEGTGVGLALCKELIELMSGEIKATSKKGSGTTFTISLPIQKTAEVSSPLTTPLSQPELATSYQATSKEQIDPSLLGTDQAPEDAPILLIIEDNPDIIAYIQTYLKGIYQIITALDGEAGIDKAIERIPDIIISDVMMPKKDGFEVCETLKTDERTSHIPIILLTAKVSQTDKIAGLRHGADAYLNKPFDQEELMVRLEKLIDLRKQLQKKYGDRLFAASSPIIESAEELPSLDDVFIEKLRKIVLENLDNPKLGIADLCEVANLSHTQVFRKLKALTGRSPSRFIRSIRLQKGLELLQTTHLNISEIAYDVGFNSPGYFYRTFLEEFGKNPSEIQRPV